MFTQNLWLATGDNGLAASMYAPYTVTAKVSSGTTVVFTESTESWNQFANRPGLVAVSGVIAPETATKPEGMQGL